MEPGKIKCPYCKKPAKLVNGLLLYPSRPNLADKKFWWCGDCDAYVGIHHNSRRMKPFGTMANAELRRARCDVHKAFDPLWKIGKFSRLMAYKWLASRMKISVEDCHIGKFNLDDCKKALEVIEQYGGKYAVQQAHGDKGRGDRAVSGKRGFETGWPSY